MLIAKFIRLFLGKPLYAIELAALSENLALLNHEENRITQAYAVKPLQATTNDARMKIKRQAKMADTEPKITRPKPKNQRYCYTDIN